MRRQIISILVLLVVLVSLVPVQASAILGLDVGDNTNGLIPCGGTNQKECTFDDLIHLARHVINYIILISIPIAAVAFSWAGYLLITSEGSEKNRAQAKEIAWKVFWGLLFIIGAWAIVNTFTSILLKENLLITLFK